ncbi:MAG TPA: hypothetical protein DD379_26195 [Cyanobacteria bacterium UBA11162]|nr:hypothetical protein [Cyanobacteria bacterium UBA12227]HAX88680.1 hypothetical protein [Cyanobacteria bacterium UBA11370]HBL14818.1 hypothetical protein [Cyanobacteria bacterium UBA11162]HBY81859.1 hypothetical protein [Cyanobacteria bacterium UBA11148]
MAFSSYKNIGAVVKEFQTTYTESDFIIETPFNINNYFREELQFMMREGVVSNSEYAICENLVYPVLREVWKGYYSKFLLWSHESLTYDEKLSGFPEYILAKRSTLGKVVLDKPYLLLVEAKQDNFDAAWGQCLAEMIAAQNLNNVPDTVVFGIASNGAFWEFGKLESNLFTKHISPYTIYELDKLFAAVNYIFQECEVQLEHFPSAA